MPGRTPALVLSWACVCYVFPCHTAGELGKFGQALSEPFQAVFGNTMKQSTIGNFFKKRYHNNSESETVAAKQTKTSSLSTDTHRVEQAVSKDAITISKCPGKRNFVVDWLRLFDWLHYDAETNSVSCKVCKQKPNSGVDEKWIGGLSPAHDSFKKETFARHDKSKIHSYNVRVFKPYQCHTKHLWQSVLRKWTAKCFPT